MACLPIVLQTLLVGSSGSDRYPRFSPDGDRIAFESDRDGDWEIYVASADGQEIRRLTERAGPDRYPAWSPDGTSLVFVRDSDLHTLEIATGATKRVKATPEEELVPDWSSDGRFIAFSAESRSGHALFILERSTGVARQLTEGPHRSVWPRFSPDGSRIAFFSRRDTDGEDDELYVMAADGSGVARITTRRGHDFCPSWSPDGRRLAAASGEPRGIGVFELDGARVALLGTGFFRVTEPTWSPDGRRIAFAAHAEGERYAIYVTPAP